MTGKIFQVKFVSNNNPDSLLLILVGAAGKRFTGILLPAGEYRVAD